MRYLKLLALFFGIALVRGAVTAAKPVWSTSLSLVSAGCYLILGVLIWKRIARDFTEAGRAEQLLAEAHREQEAAEREQARADLLLAEEMQWQVENERRIARNARRREQRAARRAREQQRPTTLPPQHPFQDVRLVVKKNVKAPPQPEPAKPVKSRWDRLLDDEE